MQRYDSALIKSVIGYVWVKKFPNFKFRMTDGGAVIFNLALGF